MKKLLNALILGIIVVFCFATPLAALDINSPAGIIMDGKDGGPLYEKNADALRPCASTTKIMSLLLIYEDLEAGKINWDTPVTISENARTVSTTPGLSNVPLKNPTYTVRELVESIVVVSGCGATVAMAEELEGSSANFVARMNLKAKELRLDARFIDETGLSSSNVMSARALGNLSQHLIKKYPQVLEITALKYASVNGTTYKTTNEMLPGGDYAYFGTDGLKTGSTTPAGKCFVGTAMRDNTRIIMVVLGASTLAQRYTDAIKMLDFGFINAPLYPLIFKDVPTTAWYYKSVETGYNNGLVAGTSTYKYEPGTDVSRAMFVTVLGRIWEKENGAVPQVASSKFPDVAKDSWYHKYADWAQSNKIVQGFEDGTFRPNKSITREEMMVILDNYNTFIDGPATVDFKVFDKFEDSNKVSDWAKSGAAWCIGEGIIQGTTTTTIDPQGTGNRAQMVTIFVNYIE